MKVFNYFLLALVMVTGVIRAESYTISGKVTDTAGEILIGANVFLRGTSTGAATNENGEYSFQTEEGKYTIRCSFVGYDSKVFEVDVTNNMEINFELVDHEFTLSVTVLADRAQERETPVAFSNLEKRDIQTKLGSQDVPLILNTTPSVYATMQGGGAGDARVNVRGFDQRNVAIMINGVPVNDMENGWVYWSNWDGVGDATSSIQMQRGLSAVNLATPSIGGTMNVITDPTGAKFGANFKQEFGNDAFFKSTIGVNTGLVNDKWAFSAVVVRKTGDGLIDRTWTDAWAYYFGASYNIDKNNRLELYGLGAPQRHGQNLYKQNAAAYSHEYAKDELGYSQAALDAFPEADAGRNYNQNWAPVSSSYKGEQYSYGMFSPSGGTIDRYSKNFINERENFFHKPIFNLNWYSLLSEKVSLYTTAYWSGGHGGGTGTYDNDTESGSSGFIWDYSGPSRIADWDANIEMNRGSVDRKGGTKVAGESLAILRNSRNNQWTLGLISKANIKISKNFKTSVGVDYRTAEIDHYREVRDLLGGNYFVYKGNDFDTTPEMQKKRLGDKIAYYNTNTVDWFGFYAQGEYSKDRLTAYGMGGYSMIKYSFTDHFTKTDNGSELTSETDNISGYQVKGGASYRITKDFAVFANGGYVSKVPIFDNAINDRDGTVADDPENEKFVNIEAGINARLLEGALNIKANGYYTTWKDRANRVTVRNQDGSDGLVFLKGLNSTHMGFELEADYRPMRELALNIAGSIGDWKLTDDVSGSYVNYDDDARTEVPFNYYVKDLKVGDQPQTAVVFTATVFPVDGFSFSALVKHYRDHYANWDPFDRTDPTDRTQSWKTPAYTLVDLHFTYDLPLNLKGVNFQLFGHLFNVLDEIYIQDATDNSQYNGFGDDHSAQSAEVYLGLPRTFNVGISANL